MVIIALIGETSSRGGRAITAASRPIRRTSSWSPAISRSRTSDFHPTITDGCVKPSEPCSTVPRLFFIPFLRYRKGDKQGYNYQDQYLKKSRSRSAAHLHIEIPRWRLRSNLCQRKKIINFSNARFLSLFCHSLSDIL